jgi:hypothetical protein
VSNFNNSANLQGTGTTIVQISPSARLSLFAELNAASLPGTCPGGIGLTTALVALRSGFVVVGSLPTTDGSAATARAGCLLECASIGTRHRPFHRQYATVREKSAGDGVHRDCFQDGALLYPPDPIYDKESSGAGHSCPSHDASEPIRLIADDSR